MAVLHIHREERAGTVTLRLEGRFDGPAALQLTKLVDELGSREVVIDFSHVKEFLDLAVAVLTRSIARKAVKLQGLGQHQERMFRYFGIGPVAEQAAPYYLAEERIAAQ